ncbi:hypothetical protein JKP88DRAFT_199316 [Tribonema minus]|uniref:Matrin-type domain-containing protein n=1 Tax=Tribonema minus TaxID=303371 RepID=A0A836CE40_9STRA|nr:hypothetical protein JKP88DRAFT_199316 [Tribonema minus]
MSLLERARAFHEDIETYEMAIIKELEAKPKTNKERVYQQHRVANLLSQAVARSKELDAIYEDKDDSMKQEVAAMRGRDALKNFYDRAKSSWSYHARYPDLPVNTGPNIDEEKEPKVTFSGEELFGKHFDLHDLYARWVNSPQCSDKRLDYGAYLAGLAALGDVPERAKRSKGYAGYVADLEAYLRGFLARTQPLVDADEIVKEAEAEFDKAWEAGRVKGWPRVSKAAPHKAAAPGGGLTARHLDLSLYHAAEDLMPLGLDRLKEALEALGLKCGGTLQQRAERLMAVKGKKPSEIDPKLLAKGAGQKRNGPPSDGPAAKRQNGNGADAADASGAKTNGVPNGKSDGGDWRRSTAAAEARVRAFLEALSDVWEATRKQVEKKQTRTVEERDAEIADEEAGTLPEVGDADEEDSDDDGPIYNPLNLPLGWDGKPIPFWLYKLHGLGVEYKCEICGDFSYWGRRAFDRHFQEFRHAHGMRCLGIPNTKHFHDITLIQDAMDLYAKLKGKLEVEAWTPDVGEEFEDSEGNVLNKRTYEDLARQGLL